LAGDQYPELQYGFIASVFERAGDKYLAWYYRPRSQPTKLTKSSGSDATDALDSTASGAVAPMVNPALDAQEYNERGIAEAERKLFDHAEQSFLTSLKLNPSSAEVWNNLCAVQLQQKRPESAIESCTRSIDLSPESGDAYYNRSLGYVQLKRFNDAMKDARSAQNFGREKEGEQIPLMIEKMKVQ
jgi:tetratricopeptide (TPR) repeat protein